MRSRLTGVGVGSCVLLVCGFVVLTAAQQKAQPVDAAATYKSTCSLCHGLKGISPIVEMNLADGIWRHGSSLKEVINSITNGIDGTAMLPNKEKFSAKEIEALAHYVRAFDPKLKETSK